MKKLLFIALMVFSLSAVSQTPIPDYDKGHDKVFTVDVGQHVDQPVVIDIYQFVAVENYALEAYSYVTNYTKPIDMVQPVYLFIESELQEPDNLCKLVAQTHIKYNQLSKDTISGHLKNKTQHSSLGVELAFLTLAS